MKQLLGIDFGTGGCKATVIDLSGNICATAFEEYDTVYKKVGWSEQEPAQWIKALINTSKVCCEQLENGFSDLLGMAITASAHNAVLMDESGDVIRNCIMWNDQRSGDQCARLKAAHGDMIFDLGMAMPTPTWTLPQLMWVKENEPDNYQKIHRILFTKDYIRSWITGDFCTDVVEAQGTLLYDAKKGVWAKELCDLIDLPMSALPPIKGSKEIVGTVLEAFSAQTGIPAGLPVIAGCTDTAAEDFSAGAIRPGQIIVKLATAGNVNVVAQHSKPHAKTYTYPYSVEGLWYTVTGTSSAASAYRWARDCLYPTEKELCEQEGKSVYQLMNEDAEKVPLGANGLLFHPYLAGERCPYFNPNARGNFFGMGLFHNKAHLSRAILEGVAYSLYDCLLVLRDIHDDFSDIAIIGGGAKSPLWCQIVSDVFGLEVRVSKYAESSFGAALLAGVGVGAFASEYEAAEKCIQVDKKYVPNMENHAAYMEYFKIYQKIVAAMTPAWDDMAEITSR